MGRIGIEMVEPGMVLAEDLINSNGRFLLGKGAKLDPSHLRVLKIWGVHSIEVEGSCSDHVVSHPDEIDSAVLQAAEEWEAKRFFHCNLDDPFPRELFRICTLRKARDMVRQQNRKETVSFTPDLAPISGSKLIPPSFDREIDPQDLLDRDAGLASLPDIFTEISRVISDPTSSAVHVADAISKDTSLSAKLLRIVNSAFYSFPSKIDTISRAVTIIGTRQLSTLAMGASVIKVFQNIPADLVDMESFWKHSIACGVSARIIASYKNISNTERLFVAGLLHDIGRILLYTTLPHVEKEILLWARRTHGLLTNAEIEALRIDHAQIGGMLLKKWKLSLVLEHGVAYHHAPLNSQHPLESSIVSLSDILANAMGIGSSGEHLVPPLMPGVWEELALPTEVLTQIIQLTDRQVAEIIHHFFNEE